MATMIRPNISTKNKYWISKHRHYELKHFCLQYPTWKKEHAAQLILVTPSSNFERVSMSNRPSDATCKRAMIRAHYAEKIDLIEKVAKEADEVLYPYILKAVTEGLSYTYLQSKMDIPCGKDMYYNRYRRFFWLLSEARD